MIKKIKDVEAKEIRKIDMLENQTRFSQYRKLS